MRSASVVPTMQRAARRGQRSVAVRAPEPAAQSREALALQRARRRAAVRACRRRQGGAGARRPLQVELAAGGQDVLPARAADRDHDVARRPGCGRTRRPPPASARSNGISGAGLSGIRLTLPRASAQQPHQLARVRRLVVDAAQQHVLVGDERRRAGSGSAGPPRSRPRSGYFVLDRHQLAAQRRVRGVQADGEVRPHRLLHQLLERGQDADRGQRQLLGRDARSPPGP